MTNCRSFFSLLFFFYLSSCGLTATRPKLEMSFAQAAFLGARKAGASSLSSTYYRKAEEAYLKAKSLYRRKYFAKAKEYALLSKKYSEKAEIEAWTKKALNK